MSSFVWICFIGSNVEFLDRIVFVNCYLGLFREDTWRIFGREIFRGLETVGVNLRGFNIKGTESMVG